MSDHFSRLRFIINLHGLDEQARVHLLRVESEAERAALFDLAMRVGYHDVAATLEVFHDNEASARNEENYRKTC